jgi:hypothetical protein
LPRTDLFANEFRAAHSVLRTPSYGAHRPDFELDEETPADRELLDELRALGYLD